MAEEDRSSSCPAHPQEDPPCDGVGIDDETRASSEPPPLPPPPSDSRHPSPRSPLVSAISATVSSFFQPFQNVLPGFLQVPAPVAAADESADSTMAMAATTLAFSTSATTMDPTRSDCASVEAVASIESRGDSSQLAPATTAVPLVSEGLAAVSFPPEPNPLKIETQQREVAAEAFAAAPASHSQKGPKKAPDKRGRKNVKAQRHGKGKSRTAAGTAATSLSPTSALALGPPGGGGGSQLRRPSNAKGRIRPAQYPVDDPHPHRIVNPLVELPGDHPVTASDLWKLLDLTFPIPDTYSVAYSARLLGYQVPITVPPNRAKTPVRFVRSLLDNRQDPIYAVPKAGRPMAFPSGDDVDDDAILGDDPNERDPFYATLLDNEHCDDATAITVAQLAKLNGALKGRVPCPLQGTLDLARELGILDQDVADDGDNDDNGRLVAALRSDCAHEGLDPSPPCGVVLLRHNEPVAWASYTFMWYPCVPNKYELTMVLYQLQTTTVNTLQNVTMEPTDELYFVLLAACALEHARIGSVHYAVVPTVRCLQKHFRMVHGGGRLVCDLHKCSSRYAFLSYRQGLRIPSSDAAEDDGAQAPSTLRRRWLAQLPLASELKRKPQPNATADASTSAILSPPAPVANPLAINPSADPTPAVVAPEIPAAATEVIKPSPARKAGKKRPPSGPVTQFTSVPTPARAEQVLVRAHLMPDGSVHTVVVPPAGGTSGGAPPDQSRAARISPKFDTDPVQIQLMRDFDVREPPPDQEPSEILQQLRSCQEALRAVEAGLHGRTHELMGCVVRERMEYETQTQARREEREIIEQYARKVERRKQLDLAWQKQLEQDMDAVCDVCNDGEVTPDNQILFCEACNVAVHQMCYGIDRIPEGDYYCIACRYLGRDKARLNANGDPIASTAPKLMPSPLPICCEFCPRKQGAYLRSAVRKGSEDEYPFGKWVHAVCAKWLGLDYVSMPDIVEDVTEMKNDFRRNRIKCHLCEGERGCMNICSFEGCDRYLHVTCARSVGTCEVIHGEDVRGEVPVNKWTLRCPDHSSVEPPNAPKGVVSVEELIQLAREFPPEPVPPPKVIEWKPFNTATGMERLLLLNDKAYERCLLTELTTKNLFGVRCDVCEQEMDPKLRMRCQVCDVVFCKDCSLSHVDGSDGSGSFKCASCLYISSKEKACEDYETPRCLACYKKSGWLRKGTAKPLTRRSQAAAKKSGDYSTSMFGKQLWVHALCAFWNPKLKISVNTGSVDCSNVVMANGRGLIQPSQQCFLCGNTGGLKIKCSHDGCAYLIDGRRVEPFFHVTCARMAGLEVNTEDDGHRMNFFIKCYRHGGNEYNLRAKMEDLLEIEKRRAGKLFAKIDAPMGFAHASRLLHSAIGVLRVIGWAWQWAELWVDYNSSWEPLLEPGQKEENMTKVQLKIVDSSRETRCGAARACRLAAFGAALRNRSYDTGEDFARETFDRALVSILRTECLVGPLLEPEIEFYRLWFALAYWSKSRYLGFGEDKIDVCATSSICLHANDSSPKFELGSRSLPGSVSVSKSDDTDNFMLAEVISDDMLDTLKQRSSPSKLVDTPALDRPRRSRGPMTTGVAMVSRSDVTAAGTSPQVEEPYLNEVGTLPIESTVDSSSTTNDEHKKRKRSHTAPVGTSNETQAVTLQPPKMRGPSRPRNIADRSAPEESLQALSSTPRTRSGRKTAIERSAGSTNSVKTASMGQESDYVENATPPIAAFQSSGTAASAPEQHGKIAPAVLLRYDRESVRRARRPPFHYEEISVEACSETVRGATGENRASEPPRRKRGRPPKLTRSYAIVAPTQESGSERSSNVTTRTRRRVSLTRSMEGNELNEGLRAVDEAGGTRMESDQDVIDEAPTMEPSTTSFTVEHLNAKSADETAEHMDKGENVTGVSR